MKNVLVTFGDEKYSYSLQRLEDSAVEIGKVDDVFTYGPSDLEGEFKRKNAHVLSQPRGAGYWIWKPYIIMDAFDHLEEGDKVVYSDAGLVVIDDLTPLFDTVNEEVNDGGKLIFRLPPHGVPAHKAKTWTKRDCFVILGCNESKYWEADMTNGAVSVWINNERNREFLREWSRYMRDPRVVTDEPNMTGPNDPAFKDHRHDQSVLTLLSVRNEYELFRDPTQFGEIDVDKFTNSPYGQLFDHHREKR